MALNKTDPASPPERFLRGAQTRQQTPYRWGRKKIKGMMLFVGSIIITLSFIWKFTAFGQGPELKVDRLLVEGNDQLSDGEILELLELTKSSNILTLDLEQVRTKLLRSAWVREVEIERILPATLTLQIQERQPVAIAVLDQMYLLAADGTVLDELSPQYNLEKLVLVRGLKDGATALSDRLVLAGRVSAELFKHQQLVEYVSELDVQGGSESLLLNLRSPPMTILVSGKTMVERLMEIIPLLEGIKQNFTLLDVVDLRFDGRVYLRTQEKGTAFDGWKTELAVTSGGASF